jgi:hypothetical protein
MRQRLKKNRDTALRDPEMAMHMAFHVCIALVHGLLRRYHPRCDAQATTHDECQGYTRKMLRSLDAVNMV